MKRLYKPLILVLVILLGILGYKYLGNRAQSISLDQTQNQNVIIKVPTKEGAKNYDVSVFVGKTVLEAMKNVGIEFETSGEGQNAFVTSISLYAADPKKREFWEFLVNGKQAEVGAGTYIIKVSDQIEWKLSNY